MASSTVIPGLESSKLEDIRDEQPRIIYSIQGEPKSLKSSFGLSGPSPQVHLDIDDRLEGVANPWIRGSRGHPPKLIKRLPLRLPKVDYKSRVLDKTVQAEAAASWELYVETYYASLKSSTKKGGVRLIANDDATSLVDLRLMAEFGRLSMIPPKARGDAYLQIGTLMREGQKWNASVVWIHELKDEWGPVKKVNDKGETVFEDARTGNRILDGYQKTHYACQVLLKTMIEPKTYKHSIQVLFSGLNKSTNGKVYTEDDWGKYGPFAWISWKQLPKITEIYDWLDPDFEDDEAED